MSRKLWTKMWKEWRQQYPDQLALHSNDLNIHETTSYINTCQTQSKVFNFLCLPRETSENLFKFESLAHLKVAV